MRRFYAHPRQFSQEVVTLDPEETLHLARVLRLGVGAKVQVCDGEGGNFAAQVATLEPRGATLRILGRLDAWGESPLPLVLGIGLAKGEAADAVVRQTTEMGVSRIVPFISERSERLTPERAARRRERWRRLARESIKSCQRSMLPIIEPPRDFAAALEGPEEVKLIFWEEERAGGLKPVLQLPPATGRQGPDRAGRRVFRRRGGPGPGGRLPGGQPGTPSSQGAHRGAGRHYPDPVCLGGPGLMAAGLPYRDLNSYLKDRFGQRVQKITLDAGLTCPNRDGRLSTGGCLYCNARGSGTGAWGRGQSIPAQMKAGMARLSQRYGAARFIAYFQSFSNTYAPLATLRELYEAALAPSQVVGLAIGTRPDCLGDEVLDLLAGYARKHLVWLELGLQSAHDATLARLNRGHNAACFSEAALRAASRGLAVVAHVILGLPGEGPQGDGGHR